MKINPVLTVTLNPAIDLHFDVRRWDEREPMRAVAARRTAGGKGVNVARVLHQLGLGATAAVALGGPDAAVYRELAKDFQFDLLEIETRGATRTNVTVRAGTKSFKVNQSGEAWTRKEWNQAKAQLRNAMRGREWVVIAGGLPPGLGSESYAELARMAKRAGAKVALDCSGPVLLNALDAGIDFLHLNRAELAETLKIQKQGLRSGRAVIDAAQILRARGIEIVALTDGPREAHLVVGAKSWRHKPQQSCSGTAMGAGDAFVAGALKKLMSQEKPEKVLGFAVACGTKWAEKQSIGSISS